MQTEERIRTQSIVPPIPGRRPFGPAHIVQGLLAGVFIFLVFLAMDSFQSHLTVASLGASTFIAFSFPHTQSARARFLIGGYCMGTLSGAVFGTLFRWLDTAASLPVAAHIPGCALAVLGATLLMTGLNFEHPPSAALAVAVALDDTPLHLGLAAIVCICVLCLVRRLLRPALNNL